VKFYDRLEITLHSGKGGDGIVAARREAKVAFGWPAWGNGGKGGSVIFVGNLHENTLVKYLYKHDYSADGGEPGRSKEQYGADGDDLILSIPLWTIIKEQKSWRILHQITRDGEKREALSGGSWGLGNMHFKSSTMQYPQFALLGEPWQTMHVILELQLLADVALIGTPSVGKSTLINAVSNTKAKVAAYHFTTLVPNLWIVHHQHYDFSLIDIPGLIEGAHEWKWLGNAFLRHILKAHIFCFVHDLSLYERGLHDCMILLEELKDYIIENYKDCRDFEEEVSDVSFELDVVNQSSIHLYIYLHIEWEKRLFLDKMLLFVFNKYDLVNDEDILNEYSNQFLDLLLPYLSQTFQVTLDRELIKQNIFVVSGATHHGLDSRLTYMTAKLRSYDFRNEVTLDLVEKEEQYSAPLQEVTEEYLPTLIEQWYIEERNATFVKVWKLNFLDIKRLVFQTMWGNDEAENYFWQMVKHFAFDDIAKDAGVRYGDILLVDVDLYDAVQTRHIQWML